MQFYENNGEYYPIRNWADYYLWYTQTYWFRFRENVAFYEYHYYAGNDEEMMRFVFGEESGVFDTGFRELMFLPVSQPVYLINPESIPSTINNSIVAKYSDIKFDKDKFDKENRQFMRDSKRIINAQNGDLSTNRKPVMDLSLIHI